MCKKCLKNVVDIALCCVERNCIVRQRIIRAGRSFAEVGTRHFPQVLVLMVIVG